MFRVKSTIWWIPFACLAMTCYGKRKDRNVPHHHSGKLKRYTPGKLTNLQLSPADIKELQNGHAVMKQVIPDDPNESGSAICIQDVYAPITAVWSQILDMDTYSTKVSKVNENKNYVVKHNSDGTCTIKTKQVLGVLPGYAYESYYDHTYYPTKNSLTWTLDYDKTSDFDDVSGHWHVEEVPNSSQSHCCRVFYSCDIKMKGSVPGPILNYISKQALKQATAWVKRESEANPNRAIPSIYASKKIFAFQAPTASNTDESDSTSTTSSTMTPSSFVSQTPTGGHLKVFSPRQTFTRALSFGNKKLLRLFPFRK